MQKLKNTYKLNSKLLFTSMLLVFFLVNDQDELSCQICNCPVGAIEIGSTGSTTDYSTTNLRNYLEGETLCVSGLLNLDVNVDFIDCVLYMYADSEIKAVGKTFGTINSEFRSCDDYLWKGISISGNSFFTITNSRFYDAKNAIDIDGDFPGLITGNLFECNKVGVNLLRSRSIGILNNVFTCPIGLKLDYSIPPSGNLEKSYAGISARFSNISASSNEFQSLYHGIVALNTSTISANGNTFRFMLIKTFEPTTYASGDGGFCVYSSNSTINSFSYNKLANSHVGIWADRSDLVDINNNQFDTLDAGIYNFHARTNSMIRENYINFSQYGIYERFSLPGIFPNIHDNSIERNGIFNQSESSGIKLEEIRSGGGEVNHNTFDLDIFCNGVQLNNCIGQIVSDNTINYSMTSTGTGDVPGKGISVSSLSRNYIINNFIDSNNPPDRVSSGIAIASSLENTLCCNRVKNGVNSFQFSGGCDRSIWQGNGSLNNYDDGLLIRRGALMGPQPRQITNTTLKSSFNVWNPTNSIRFGDARNLNGAGPVARRSVVTAKGCILPEWPQIISPSQSCNTNANNWFNSISSSGAFPACSSLAECDLPIFGLLGDPDEYISDNDILLASGEFGLYENGNILEWEASKHLIINLLAHPDLISLNSIVDSFFTANSSSNLMQFIQIDSLLFKGSAISDSLIDQNYQYVNQIGIYSSIIDSIFQVLDSVVNPQDSITILGILNENSSNLDSLQALIQVNFETHTDLIDSIKSLIQSKLDSISPINSLEENEKLIRQLHIDLILTIDSTADSLQLVQLASLSALCPFQEGNLVYWARGIYSLYNSEATFNDDSICIETEELITNTNDFKNKLESINVIPNPANDYLILKLNLQLQDNLKIKIISINGIEMYNTEEFGINEVIVNTQFWPSGLYQLLLFNSGNLLYTKSISIVK